MNAPTGEQTASRLMEPGEEHQVSGFFVDKRRHGRHVGRELMIRTVEMCLKAHPNLRETTADTPECGLSAYTAMGFERAGPPKVSHGRHFLRVRQRLPRRGRR